MPSDRPARDDALITVREREVEVRQRALALRQRELARVRGEIDRLGRQLEAAAPAPVRPGDPLDLDLRRTSDVRRAALRATLSRAHRREDQLERDVEARREELVEARRHHRAAEVLKERLLARLAAEQARRERVAMDEVGTLRHGRR